MLFHQYFPGYFSSCLTSIAFVGALLTGEIERVDTFVAENLLYLLMIFLILVIATNFKKLKRASFTPFILIQLFALIIAWPLLQSAILITRGLGLLIGISGLLGLLLGLLPENRKKFI